MRRAQIRVYRAADGWRWRQVAANGTIVADGGQAYDRPGKARQAAHRASTCPLEAIVDGKREQIR